MMDINKFNELWITIFENNTNVSDEEFNMFLQFLVCFQILEDLEGLCDSESQKDIIEHQLKKKSLRLFKVYIGGELNVN